MLVVVFVVVIGVSSVCNGMLMVLVVVEGLGMSGNKREEYLEVFWGLFSDLREEEDEDGGGCGWR